VATKRGTERAHAAAGDAGRPAVPAGQVPAALRARHTRDLRILAAIAEALNSAPDVQQAMEQTLGMVAELLGLETGWVWLRDPETQRFYNAAARNLPPFLREPVRMTGRSCWCLDEFRAGDLTPKNIDVMECSRLRPAVRQRATELTHGLAYHASIPLYFQATPLGVMNVTGPAWRQLTADELRVLATIAYQVGIAIERARLAESMTRLARAEERARLAREIHDTLAQALTAIALHLEAGARHLARNPERAGERIQRALEITRQSLGEARRSMLELRGPLPAGRPLPEALTALARALSADSGVRIHVRVAPAPPLPAGVESELFQIAREALTNVGRHAHASDATVTLAARGRRARLTIRDNGRGFAPERTAPGRVGLVGMRERVELLGGTLRIRSAPGRGTWVSVSVPLEGPRR
jgi:two-component system NarL family sensor kinase